MRDAQHDSTLVHRIDAKTVQVLTYEGGRILSVLTRRVSDEGRRMTAVVIIGDFVDTRIFDKQ